MTDNIPEAHPLSTEYYTISAAACFISTSGFLKLSVRCDRKMSCRSKEQEQPMRRDTMQPPGSSIFACK